MSNLNDNVLNDLDTDTPVEDDLIKDPQSLPKQQNEVTVVAKSDLVTDQVTELSETDLTKLVESDVSFKLVGQKMDKIEELEEVESMILANESICRADASDVFNSLGVGYNFRRVSLEEFTQHRSTTNYQYTLKLLNTEITNHKDEASKMYIEYITNHLLNVKETVESYVLNKCDYLMELLDHFNDDHIDMINGMESNKNLVIPYGDGFVNITEVMLNDLDFGKLKDVKVGDAKVSLDTDSLMDVIGTLRASLTGSLRNFIENCKRGNMDRNVIPYKFVDKDFSLQDLNAILKNRSMCIGVQTLKNILEQQVTKLSEVIDTFNNEVNVSPVDFDKVRAFNQRHGVLSGQYEVNYIVDMCKMVNGLILMTHSLDVVYGELEKM